MAPMSDRPLRIVQWTTGNVARQTVRAELAHPGLELVGAFAHSAEKVGRDVGALVGLDPVGVAATDDVDGLLALAPDHRRGHRAEAGIRTYADLPIITSAGRVASARRAGGSR